MQLLFSKGLNRIFPLKLLSYYMGNILLYLEIEPQENLGSLNFSVESMSELQSCKLVCVVTIDTLTTYVQKNRKKYFACY